MFHSFRFRASTESSASQTEGGREGFEEGMAELLEFSDVYSVGVSGAKRILMEWTVGAAFRG